MKRLAALASALLALPAASQTEPGWTLVWSDEFDGTAIDPAKWTHAVDCWGGGNEERQCYTDRTENSSVGNGMLAITARLEPSRGPAFPADQRTDAKKQKAEAKKPFSSAKLSTRGKGDWRYGRFEIRAKLPEGQGSWPAIWMLPTDSVYGPWAASGEIDIMEAVNLGEPVARGSTRIDNRILGTLHFGGTWPNNTQLSVDTALPPSTDGFHTYRLDWSAGLMRWSIDGKVFATQTAADWSRKARKDGNVSNQPFDQPFHLILNLAIGGGLPEGRNLGGVSNTGFPKQMLVDWVRVYRCTADPDTGKACAQ